MKTEAEKEIEELREEPNKVLKFVKLMKRNGKDIKGRKWIKGRDGRIGFSEEHQCKTWREHMESIMIEENAWDQRRTQGGGSRGSNPHPFGTPKQHNFVDINSL